MGPESKHEIHLVFSHIQFEVILSSVFNVPASLLQPLV